VLLRIKGPKDESPKTPKTSSGEQLRIFYKRTPKDFHMLLVFRTETSAQDEEECSGVKTDE